MNKTLLLLGMAAGIMLGACQNNHVQQGAVVNDQDAQRIDAALLDFIKNGQEKAVVFGRTQEVCQSEGCWFSYELEPNTVKALEAFENSAEGPLRALHVDFEEGISVPTNLKKADLYCSGTFQVSQETDSSQKTVVFRASGVRFKTP
ncbi:MAG: hypothetical protein ACO3GK_02270 [Bacteroidia bacterium]